MPKYILQWNCNGYFNNLQEIKLLLQDYQPNIIFLQESHLTGTIIPIITGYNIYTTNSRHTRARGGVLTGIKSNINSAEVTLNTNIEAVAVAVNYPSAITICNIYLPPSEQLLFNELDNLINQLPSLLLYWVISMPAALRGLPIHATEEISSIPLSKNTIYNVLTRGSPHISQLLMEPTLALICLLLLLFSHLN